MEDVHENKLVVGIRAKPEPHTIEDDSRKDKTTANDASMNPDPSIVHTSDDPRRGGKLRCSDIEGTKINTPNASSQWQATRNDRNNESQSFGGRLCHQTPIWKLVTEKTIASSLLL